MVDLNAPYVWVQYADGMYVCGDEDGEFARADHVETILAYVTDLILGPGTMRDTGLNPAQSLGATAGWYGDTNPYGKGNFGNPPISGAEGS